jgi:signal peptidase II
MFTLSIAVFLIDQLSKFWIIGRLGPFDEIVVVPNFFHLIHVRNTGAAFGMLAEAPDWVRVTVLIGFSSTAVLALVYFLWKVSGSKRYGGWCLRFGLALILGGALGNIFDRAFHGNVVDFLDFFIGSWHWYTFNIADSAICVGTGLMLIDLWRTNPEPQPHAS